MWKHCKKANFCRNLAKMQNSVEIVQQTELLWKLSNKENFHGNLPRTLRENFSTKLLNFCGNFETNNCIFWWSFANKTVWNLEGVLYQNSLNICKNLRQIHQTAKISVQQCCHAARVFVNLVWLFLTVCDHINRPVQNVA